MGRERMIVLACGVLLTMGAFLLAGSGPVPRPGALSSHEKPGTLVPEPMWFALDDGTEEIFLSSDEAPFIIANRFDPGRPVVLASASFYTGGAAAGSRAQIIVYEDPTGASLVPDAAMEVFREEVTIGSGRLQAVPLDGLILNGQGRTEAAFYVGIAALPGETPEIRIC